MATQFHNAEHIIEAVCSRDSCISHGGGALYRGFWPGDSYSFDARLPESFRERPDWADSRYRVVWLHDADRAIVTYCEGDITVEKYADAASFAAGIASAHECYMRDGR